MDWKEADLAKIMFFDEKLIWGLKTKVLTPKMRNTYNEWFDEYVFFTDQRILILWDIVNNNLLQIPYDAINTINPEGAPASGGVAGVKCAAKGGGVVGVASSYGSIRIQFPDSESLKYGEWLLQEVSRGTQLTPPPGTPIIEGQVDPNATPQPPKQKSGGCFIATVAYGSPMAKEVITICKFRDQILNQYCLGRIIIEKYYVISPPIAEIINKSFIAKNICRIILYPIILLSKWGTRCKKYKDL